MPGPMSGGIVDQANGPLGTQGPPVPPQTQSVQLPAQVDPNTTSAQRVLGGAYNAPNAPNAPQPQVHPLVASAAKTGMGWHALMGSHGEVGPNGTVVQAPNKPGDLFRSILAGAIMGASTGAQARMGGGVGSFAVGAGAAQQQAEQEKDKLQQQSQQQFQNQQQLAKEQRETSAAATEDTLRKAQVAQANTETLRLNQMIQGESFDLHQKMADAGKSQIQPYVDAGMTPVAKDIPESQQHQYLVDHPGATSLDWELTGTKLGVDADGKPTYEGTYTAFDPKGKVNVSTSTYNQWKKDGLFDRFPEYGAILKDGRELTAQQFVQIKKDADKTRADNVSRQLQDLGVKKVQVEIDKDNAEKSKWLADAGKVRQEVKDASLGKTQALQFDNALQELNKNNGNFDALQPSSRVIIAESMNKMVPALNQEYRDILSDPTNPNQQAEAGQVLSQIQNLTSLGTRAMAGLGQPPPDAKVLSALQGIPGVNPEAASRVAAMKPEEIKAFLATANIPADKKAAVYAALGETPPPVAASAPNPQPWGAHSTPSQDLQKGIQNAPPLTPNTAAVSF